MRQQERTEYTRVGDTPMNIDVGRVEAREVVQLGSLTILSLAIGCLGAWFVWLALPDYGQWSGWQVFFTVFGLGVACIGIGCALIIAKLTVVDWTSYHRRLDEWHYAHLDAYCEASGAETITHTRTMELSANDPRDVLLATISTHLANQSGKTSAHSQRQLTGEHWLGAPKNELRLGDMSQSQAEKLNRAYVQMGLIARNAPTTAGEWTPKTLEDAILMVTANWHKVKR